MRFLTAIFIGVLFGCGPLIGAKRADKDFYLLTDNGHTPESSLAVSNLRLLVRDTKANRFINSHKIIFSELASKRGYYQLAHWVEPPPDRFTLLLIERLERVGVFSSVSRLASSTLGELQLNTEIVEFYHNISDMPGEAVVRVNAEFIDIVSRRILARRVFSTNVQAKSYSAAGAVAAFSEAVNEILDEMIVWLAHSAQTNEPEVPFANPAE